jgi:hypothetical protein
MHAFHVRWSNSYPLFLSYSSLVFYSFNRCHYAIFIRVKNECSMLSFLVFSIFKWLLQLPSCMTVSEQCLPLAIVSSISPLSKQIKSSLLETARCSLPVICKLTWGRQTSSEVLCMLFSLRVATRKAFSLTWLPLKKWLRHIHGL